MAEQKVMKEPLFHIAKRDSIVWWKAWLIRMAIIALSLAVCALITVVMTGENPVGIFTAMIKGAVGTTRRTWNFLQNVSIMLLVAIALTPAFKMRFWNTGGEGQILIGGLASAACMVLLGDKLPNWLLIIVITVSSIVAGAIWALIPAFFKAKWNTNETLFTLMMNYIATQIVSFFVYIWSVPKGSGKMGVVNSATHSGWLPNIGGNGYLLNIIIVLAITAVMYIYLRYSKQGYEITVVGESENTARYIGISVKKVIIRTLAISGALCGIAGMLLVAGTDHTLTTNTADGRGFTAIMVSWMAKFNPIFMILTSFLIVLMEKGASEISTIYGLNDSFSDILTGIIIFFIIGSEFFINYTFKFRESKKGGIKE